jgi:alcohol dehydrogenase (cytochrome c)
VLTFFFAVSVLSDTQQARRPTAVTFHRILRADREPHNWLTYSGTLSGWRYSSLTQITSANINELELEWIWQAQTPVPFSEATALVVDGVLYTVQAPNDVVALDAATGRVIWTYSYVPKDYKVGYRVNRGLAILGSTLFMGTLDAHLLAVDASSGKLIWDATVADSADPACKEQQCYAITHAPLVVKDRVIVGPSGGEGLIRGFIAAFDVRTGKEAWRFWTIPGPGERGSETWSGDSWKTGGGCVWNTGTYDPDLNLTYWGIGNPAPYDATARPGDNLYTESVVALDADTGKLKWYYQFTPHDEFDWDSTQVPVLTDIQWQGQPRKVMLFANRNGLLYVLDRVTGEFLLGKPFVEVNWMSGFDVNGRPLRSTVALHTGFDDLDWNGKKLTTSANPPLKPGPGELGATNWYPPSYSPETGLFYVPAWESSSNPRYSAIRAFDPRTGDRRWEFKKEHAIFKSGALTTASHLLFAGAQGQFRPGLPVGGQFYALDARTGQLLWQRTLPLLPGGGVHAGPISYSVGDKQYVAVVAGNTLFAYALRQ